LQDVIREKLLQFHTSVSRKKFFKTKVRLTLFKGRQKPIDAPYLIGVCPFSFAINCQRKKFKAKHTNHAKIPVRVFGVFRIIRLIFRP